MTNAQCLSAAFNNVNMAHEDCEDLMRPWTGDEMDTPLMSQQEAVKASLHTLLRKKDDDIKALKAELSAASSEAVDAELHIAEQKAVNEMLSSLLIKAVGFDKAMALLEEVVVPV